MSDTQLQKTPLYDAHMASKARMVPFADWCLPVMYSSVIEEHNAVRNHVGIFDVSHMGEITCHGRGASEFLQYMTINSIEKMEIGHAQYNAICNEKGGIIDDIVLYKRGFDSYLLCVNAANTETDFQWLKKHLPKQGVILENVSEEYAQIAIQGPKSFQVLSDILDIQSQELKFYHFAEGKILGVPGIISRTGYTGELGYELYLPPSAAPKVWNRLLEIGHEFQLKPCGLGCRDTLRLEAGFLLHGSDMSSDTTPLECGLSWITKFAKEDFVGKKALLSQKESGDYKRLVGFEMVDKGIGRGGYPVYANQTDDRLIGLVTSGSPSPTLSKNIGFCFVPQEFSSLGSEIFVQIRNERKKAVVTQKRFLETKK